MTRARNPRENVEESGRVSPTAPESKSLSAAVWRFLEKHPGFNRAMEEGTAQIKAGKSVTLRQFRRGR
jgi:hypothetical protein